MNTRKYFTGLIVCLAILALFTVTAGAQGFGFKSQSFLNVQAVYVTNLLSATNLSTAMPAATGNTNQPGFAYSNLNSRVVVSNTSVAVNLAAAKTSPFKDVNLWPLKDGSGPWTPNYPNNGWDLGNKSFANVAVTWEAGSGADSAVTFVLTPIYDGVHEATTAGEEWTFAFTPTVSTTSSYATNAPLWRWPGASKLRLRRVVNTDTTAAAHVILRDVSLNGFPP